MCFSLSFDESLFSGRADGFLEIEMRLFIKAYLYLNPRNTVEEGILSSTASG